MEDIPAEDGLVSTTGSKQCSGVTAGDLLYFLERHHEEMDNALADLLTRSVLWAPTTCIQGTVTFAWLPDAGKVVVVKLGIVRHIDGFPLVHSLQTAGAWPPVSLTSVHRRGVVYTAVHLVT